MTSPAGAIEREWLDRAEKFCFRARLDRAHYDGPVFARGEGSVVWDVEGKSYLDFNSGQLCAALGHNPPRVVAAIARASKTMMHASSTYYNIEEIALAEKLASLLPPSLNKSFFGMAGSDSTEAAINIAKKVTGRNEIASPHLSFHGLGDTPRALSFANWHRGMNPSGPGNFAIMAPYCFRCPIHQTFPQCQVSCLAGSLQVLDAETIAPIAAVITEPIFSAGGVIEPPPGWLRRVREACDERASLLILDEAQTGLAKLGTMWGFEHEGVVPDILTISKHFGGGIAICAVVTTEEIENTAIENGFAYSHSHSSDPLACAAALATLETIEEENLVERARTIGSYWRKHLETIRTEHDVIADVRGRGLLQGIELQTADGRPASEIGPQVAQTALELGLLFSVRRAGSVIRFTPPFTTTEDQMDRAATILDESFSRTERRP
ncbi:MAG: aspartate aminotransferase family protein [Streptosporangiaceae bacterium]